VLSRYVLFNQLFWVFGFWIIGDSSIASLVIALNIFICGMVMSIPGLLLSSTESWYSKYSTLDSIFGELRLGVTFLYLFMLFATDTVRQHFIQNQPNYDVFWDDSWSSWVWPGVLYISVPIGIYALLIGVLERIKPSFCFGLYISTVGIVYSIVLGLWYTQGGLKWVLFIAICSSIASIPGFLLSKK
jgi:hypothetical protein